MHEADVLVAHDLDLVDQPETAEVVTQLLLRSVVIESAEIDVPTCVALTDREGDLAGNRRRLSPTDLKLLPVKGKFFDRGVSMERRGSRAI